MASGDSCSDTDSGFSGDHGSDQAERSEVRQSEIKHSPKIVPCRTPVPPENWPKIQKSDTCPEIVRSRSPQKRKLRVRFADEVDSNIGRSQTLENCQIPFEIDKQTSQKPLVPPKSATLARCQKPKPEPQLAPLQNGVKPLILTRLPDSTLNGTGSLPKSTTLSRIQNEISKLDVNDAKNRTPNLLGGTPLGPLHGTLPRSATRAPPSYRQACQRIETLKDNERYYYTTDPLVPLTRGAPGTPPPRSASNDLYFDLPIDPDDSYSKDNLRAKSNMIFSTFGPKSGNNCVMESCDGIVSLDNKSPEEPCVTQCRLVGLDSRGVQTLTLTKTSPKRPFGFFIASGTFRNKKGIFISRISAPSLTPVLAIGDELLSVDGRLTRHLPLEQVQGLMANKDKITLRLLPAVGRADVGR